jgi:ABC-type bacteriocin/lantibiotic exporter with double-glycine peptidase domain
VKINILSQPDDSSCGPTSLQAVYAYLGHKISLDLLLDEVRFLSEGGTLAVLLGLDALKRGFSVKVYSYNLRIFDPTWHDLDCNSLIEKLQLPMWHKTGNDLTKDLLLSYFKLNIPVLDGLNENKVLKI